MSSSTPLVRAANFRLCDEPQCTFNGEPHLIVSIRDARLVRGEAIAVSYIWGEYSRQKVTIGHYADGAPVLMELGQEWDKIDFLSALDDLCKGTITCCWIDQISIPQNHQAIRNTLARIPDIYRTFNVVVLFPGKICSCQLKYRQDLQQVTRSAESGSELSNREVAMMMASMRPRLCINNYAYGMWFMRLWTRQEFLYATNIRAKWVSNGQLECPQGIRPSPRNAMELPSEFWGRLSTSTKCRLERELGQQSGFEQRVQAVTSALDSMRVEATKLHSACEHSAVEWGTLHSRAKALRGGDGTLLLNRLLCGEPITSEVPDEVLDDAKRVHYFLHQLVALRRSSRAATKARDYVLAVWTDCPGYQIPSTYEDMSLAALLEDAVKQLKRNHSRSIATSVPSGLFGADGPGGLWRPSVYLDSATVQDCQELYGVILDPLHHYHITTDRLPLRNPQIVREVKWGFETAGPTAVHHVLNYEHATAGFTTEEAFEFLVMVAQDWPFQVTHNMMMWTYSRAINTQRDSFQEPPLLPLFLRLLINRINYASTLKKAPQLSEALKDGSIAQHILQIQPDLLVDREGKWPPGQEGDHRASLFYIICIVLGIKPEIAKAKGLRLMVDMGRWSKSDAEAPKQPPPPRLGLTWIDFGAGDEIDTQTVRAASPLEDSHLEKGLFEVIDVDLDDGKEQSTGEDSAPFKQKTYRAVGVWAPSTGFPGDYVEAFAHFQAEDAFLV